MASSGSSTQDMISDFFDILQDEAVELGMQRLGREPVGMEKEFHSRIVSEALRVSFAVYLHEVSDKVDELPAECHLNLSSKYSQRVLQFYHYLKRESQVKFGGPRSIASIIHQSYINRKNDHCKMLAENLTECVNLYFKSLDFWQETDSLYVTRGYYEFVKRDVEIFSKRNWQRYTNESGRIKERAQQTCIFVLNTVWDIISSYLPFRDEFQRKT
ncbi:hypothetical protein GUITHDRAFT_154545, partial [Guillardia theta CCMP2712]